MYISDAHTCASDQKVQPFHKVLNRETTCQQLAFFVDIL